MKNIFMLLLLTSSMTVFAQVPYDEIPLENQEEAIYPDENYETEMFQQKQEDFANPTYSESPEDLMAGEEVYDNESDPNY